MKIRKLSLKKILFHDVNFTKFLEYLILFFFSIKPDYFSELGSIATLYNLGVFAVTAYLVLKLIRKRNLSIVSILVIGITLFPMLVSIFMDVEMTMSMFIFPAQTINLTLIIALGTDKWFREMLFAFTLILEIYVYVNFFSIILFPAGLIESDLYSGMYWFLGYKNVMIRFLLPAVFLKAIMCVYVAGRYTIGFYLVYIITFATQIITDCKTGLLGVGIIGIMLYFFSYNRMPKWLNLRNAY